MYVYGWLTEHADEEAREKLDKAIFDPPGGVTRAQMESLPEWQPAAMGADFMALAASRGVV